MHDVLPAPGGFLDLFRRIAAAEPERPFARVEGVVLSFGALNRESDALAGALLARGLQSGDRVAVMLPNGRAMMALIYALAKAGLVWVPLNPELVGAGLRYILAHARPKLLMTEEVLGSLLGESGEPAVVEPAPEADFAICYTSGTTGPPKGVRVSHRMLRLAGEGVILVADARDGDVMLLWEPMHHIGGAQMLVAPLLRRLVLHLVPRFSASRFWGEVVASGATHIHYLGGILQILLKQPVTPSERAHGVRIAWGGGCPVEIWDAVQARFGVALRECYGMTESSSFSTYNANGVRGSVGRAMPWFDIALSMEGEILVHARDPLAITQGYLDNPEASARALRDGALHTGDSGRLDAEGNLYFGGRMGDSARVRGQNVAAWEVESVAAQYPDVADCAMIGVAAEIGEQEIKLFVQPRDGTTLNPEALSAWLSERLARYQLPRYIAVVPAFERTPSQRIMKHRLSRDTTACWDRLRT